MNPKESVNAFIMAGVIANAKDLNWTEKILCAIIDAYDHGDGCFASNKHLSSRLQCSEGHAADLLSKLREKGYVFDRTSADGGRRLHCRYSVRGCSTIAPRGSEISEAASGESVGISDKSGHKGTDKSEHIVIHDTVSNVLQKPKARKCPPAVFAMASEWKLRYGGDLPIGRAIRALKPTLDDLPTEAHDDVLSAWKSYLVDTEATYASPERFISIWKTFLKQQDDTSPARPVDRHSD